MDPDQNRYMKSNFENKIRSDRAEKKILLRRIAPNDSAKNIYADDKVFVQDLAKFVKDGLQASDCIVVIASEQHLAALEDQLRVDGVDIFYLTLRDQYIPLNADLLLDKFMVNNWPDEVLFRHLVMSLASRALKNDRHIRAFSEMAALMWLKGHRAASVQLELIWNKLLQTTTEFDYVRLKSEVLPPSDDNDTPFSFLKS